MQAGNDLMEAIFGLQFLFVTVFCILPAALTFIEVQRLRKELNEIQVSAQSSTVTKNAYEPFFLHPTTESE
jgi:hypothetical protein